KNGADIIRINFSHASFDFAEKALNEIKSANRDLRRDVKILADLKGNRIRVKGIKSPFLLSKNKIVRIGTDYSKEKNTDILFDYLGNFLKVKTGDRIFIEDGKIELKVIEIGKYFLKARSLSAGEIKNSKGVNFPDTDLDFPNLSEEDKEDLKFVLNNDFSYIAQSFVRNEKDIKTIREISKKSKFKPKIIAKIENRQAVENLRKIISASDGAMVARGDLAISTDFYKVPILQKKIIAEAKSQNKFTIIATQMLESMTYNPLPTRAEASDAANAVFDKAEFVMLSGETAAGAYPSQSVKALNLIIKEAEKYLRENGGKI
ncbi:MAG: pyruvate kinase, partial [Elusimicrobia bacterium]|nr:pyruvate kinase [Elusimicrobiota bacterium]